MRLEWEIVDQLRVPSETDRHGVRVCIQPAVVMSAPLPEPSAVRGEPQQRHEQHVRYDAVSMLEWLQETERSALAVTFIPWIVVDAEFHGGVAAYEAGQGDALPTFVKKPGITACRCLMRASSIKADRRIAGDKGEKRRRRAMQDQRAGRGIQPGNMRSPRRAKLFAKCSLIQVSMP